MYLTLWIPVDTRLWMLGSKCQLLEHLCRILRLPILPEQHCALHTACATWGQCRCRTSQVQLIIIGVVNFRWDIGGLVDPTTFTGRRGRRARRRCAP